MSDFNQAEYIKQWSREHTKTIHIRLNNDNDADILGHLATVGNKNDYLKKLIRADIERKNNEV